MKMHRTSVKTKSHIQFNDRFLWPIAHLCLQCAINYHSKINSHGKSFACSCIVYKSVYYPNWNWILYPVFLPRVTKEAKRKCVCLTILQVRYIVNNYCRKLIWHWGVLERRNVCTKFRKHLWTGSKAEMVWYINTDSIYIMAASKASVPSWEGS
jgi:hypothetical protein